MFSGSSLDAGEARGLGGARLHTGPRAARMCAALRTPAFSVDGHVVSTRPLDAPQTAQDRELRAHERHHLEAHAPVAPGVIFRAPPTKGDFDSVIVSVDGEQGDTIETLSYKALARLYGYDVFYVQGALQATEVLTEIQRVEMTSKGGTLAKAGKVRITLSAEALAGAAEIFGLPPTKSPFSEGEGSGASLTSSNSLIQDLIAAGDASAARQLLWSREDEIGPISSDDRITFVQVLMNYGIVGKRSAKQANITRFNPPDCPTAPLYRAEASDIPPAANDIVEEISESVWRRYLFDYRAYLDRYAQETRAWNSWFKVREEVGLLAEPCPIPMEVGQGVGKLYIDALNAPLDKVYELADVKKPGTLGVSGKIEVSYKGDHGAVGAKVEVSQDTEGRGSGTATGVAKVKIGDKPKEGAEQDNRSEVGGELGGTIDNDGARLSSDDASITVGGDSANLGYNAAKDELSVGAHGAKVTGKKDGLEAKYGDSGVSMGKTEADYDGDGTKESYGKGSTSAKLASGAKSSASFDEATGDVEIGVGVGRESGSLTASAELKAKVKIVGGFEQMLIARALGRGQPLLTQPVGERHPATEELRAGTPWRKLPEDRRLNLVLKHDWSKGFWSNAVVPFQKAKKKSDK